MKRIFRHKDGKIIETTGNGFDIFQKLFGYEYDRMRGTINSSDLSRWKEIVNDKQIAIVIDKHIHVK